MLTLVIWTIQIKFTYQVPCCCLYGPVISLFCSHNRRQFQPSNHFNSIKDHLFSSSSLKNVSLNLKSIDTNDFVVRRGLRFDIIRPSYSGVIINKIIYRDKELPLSPTPLYREVYRFKQCLFSYLYVMSYYGEENTYFQVYRKMRGTRLKYSLYDEDNLPDGLLQGGSIINRVSNLVYGKDIRINVFGDLINKNISRFGDKNKFYMVSLTPTAESSTAGILSNYRVREFLDFGGYFTMELPRDYDYFVLFKDLDSISLIVSVEGLAKFYRYQMQGDSYVQQSAIDRLEPVSTLEFEDLYKEANLEAVQVDLTKPYFPNSLICNYHDNELTITPKPGKVITKIIIPGTEVDLNGKFPSNYVKVKFFSDVDIVFISGLSPGDTPLSLHFVINKTQNTAYQFHQVEKIDSSFKTKELDYNKNGIPVSIEINVLSQVISHIGNTTLFSGEVTDTIFFCTSLGKVDELKIDTFRIEAQDNCLANFFMYLKDKSLLISVTMDKMGLMNIKSFMHIIRGNSSSFRLIPPDKSKNIISELNHQLYSNDSDTFEKTLFVDVKNAKASPGIKITHLPDKSLLYTVDSTLFEDNKKSYISSVKFGSHRYKLKPGWAQIGVYTLNNSETLVIIDEMESADAGVSRTIFSIPHVTTSSILSKSTKVDWDNPILMNHLKITPGNVNSNPTDYHLSHVMNFVMTDPRGLAGVITKLDFGNNSTIYLPVMGSGIIIGDVVYHEMVDKWHESYIFTLVKLTKSNENTSTLTIYRLSIDKVKVISYNIVDEVDCSYIGDIIYESNTADKLLEPLVVDLDLKNIDKNIFLVKNEANLNTVTPTKHTDEAYYNGRKYKIGTVKLADGLNDKGYPRYSEKKVDFTEDKISILSLVDNVWLSEVYEKSNGEFKFVSKDPLDDLLGLENLQPRKGMQYITLEMENDRSINFLRLKESFYYCGKNVTIKSAYAYAMLINNGNYNTSLWFYQVNPNRDGEVKILQCNNVPFINPKFNTSWVDSSHVLNMEMAKQIQNSKLLYAKLSTLNIDLDFLPTGVIKAHNDNLTVYTCPNRSIGNVAFGNVNLSVNSIFTRVFVNISDSGRFVLVESYKEGGTGIVIDAFKENEYARGCYTKINLSELEGQLEHMIGPYSFETGSTSTYGLVFPR